MIKGYTFKAAAVGMIVGVAVTLSSHGHVCQQDRCSAWSDQPDGPSSGRRTVQLYGPPVVVIASSVIPRS